MSDDQSSSEFDVLTVGLSEDFLERMKSELADLRLKNLQDSESVENFLEEYELKSTTPVLVSTKTQGMTHLEVGQALTSCYSGIELIFFTDNRDFFNLDELHKNGFSQTLLLPLDKQVLVDVIEEVKSKKSGGGYKKYKPVKLIDIQSDKDLPFGVHAYLPLNDRYVILNASGKLSEKKAKLLKSKQSQSVFVEASQMETFYDYTAEQLIAAGQSSNDVVSATERSERIKSSVRDLFRSILDVSNNGNNFEEGKALTEQSKKIVESYVSKKTGLSDLNAKLQEVSGDGGDLYSHAQTVSTVACLLSLATGIGEPEDLAIAGLFHDIGIHSVDEDVSIFSLDKLTDEARESYQQHPRRSLNMLKEKKITVPPKIAEIIEKHHERHDGRGYPAQLPGHKVPLEAQLLAYADAFEYLTRTQPGQAVRTPLEVHKEIGEKLSLSPDLLSKVKEFLEESPGDEEELSA